MNNIQKNKAFMALCVIILFIASSCSGGSVYMKSVDIHQQGWAPTDTVLFKLYVFDESRGNTLLVKDHGYNMSLSFRFASDYKYTKIPVHLQIDSILYKVSADAIRKSTWGSLDQEEIHVKSIPIMFSDTGTHVITILPDTVLEHVYSVGIELQ